MKGKNTTTFLPLKSNLGGPVWYGKDGENKKMVLERGYSHLYVARKGDAVLAGTFLCSAGPNFLP